MIMVNAVEAAQEYKMTLAELQNNNKTQINLLTILAEDYQEFAPSIVEVIENHVFTVPREQKLLILYVTDSIIKNVTNSPYKDLFGKIIIKMFIHIFVNADEKTRSSMYKVRQTWKGIFNASLLYRLDMRVQKEDSAWPLSAPPTTSTSTAPASAAASPRVHVNPKFIKSQQQQSSTSNDPRLNAASNRTVSVDAKNRQNVRVEVKKEPSSGATPSNSTDVLDSILGQNGKVIKNEPEEPKPTNRSPQPPPKRRAEEPPTDPERKKKRTPDSTVDRKPYVHRPPRSQPSPPMAGLPFVSASTAQPGSHAFAVPPVVVTSSAPSMPPAGPPPFHPPPPVPVSRPGPPPPFMPPPHSQVPPPHCSIPSSMPPHFAGPPPPFGRAPPPFPFPPGGAPPAALPAPVEITHDTVRLEGIPANNRIFVDSRAHEVFYIEDSAVIERNGLPHRIYFAGPPHNVLIDGEAHLLAFGERKTVMIDGLPHVLRYGAPSRELYMGDFAFKGQFGGPPIMATINGVRHEIRLAGPAPEVKIEPDPAYDLTRFMPHIRDGRPPEAKPDPANPFEILKRLQKSGFLQRKPAVEERPQPAQKPKAKESTPPIPSEHTFDMVERRSAPANSLRDFNMRLLKVRYDAIVDALHEKRRDACPHCGLRMELKGEKYDRHLDWHVKRNLQTLERTSTSRPWYHGGKDWLRSEDESMPGTSSGSRVKTEDSGDSGSAAPAIGSNETTSKECYMCSERFEEYFDEEDDCWKLKNCLILNGKTLHSGCAQDISFATLNTSNAAPIKSESDSIVEDVKPMLNNLHATP